MRSAWQVLKKVGPLLFVVTALGLACDQLLTEKMEMMLANPEGTSNWIWFFGFLSMMVSMLYPLLALSLILSAVSNQNFANFISKNLPLMFREQMRAWGKAMSWSLLLILPGLYRFIQYLLVPFIVCLDPGYQQGQKDALLTSQRMTKGNLLKLCLWVFLFSLVFPFLLTMLDEYKTLWKTPLPALLLCFVEMILNLSFALVLTNIYQKDSRI